MKSRGIYFVLLIVFLIATSFMLMTKQIKLLSTISNIDNKSDCFYVAMADWCGHCKVLKKSGELEKLNEKVDVTIIPNDHPKVSEFLKENGCEGYPAIVACKKGTFVKYEGKRSSDEMVKFFNKL